MRAEFAIKILSLFKVNEEIATKELIKRYKTINNGYNIKASAINKILCNELKDKVESCGKNKWRLLE